MSSAKYVVSVDIIVLCNNNSDLIEQFRAHVPTLQQQFNCMYPFVRK